MDPIDALVPRPAPALHQRAGDLDRNTVCELLSAHYAAGRLPADELDARLGAAVHATTLVELRRLTADLPPLERAAVPPAPVVRRGPTALDVVAVLVLIGCLGLAGLLLLALALGGGGFALVGLVAGTGGAVGGVALAHLLHRGWTRMSAAAERDAQRPRIA